MDAVRLGLAIRALRRRRSWTQAQLGRRIGCSDQTISRLERGQAGRVTLRQLERVLESLGARLLLRALWQGEELDRLLDAGHARMVDLVLELLGRLGWEAFPEVTFAIDGERGSVDVLGFHRATGTLLVVEVKSVVPDAQAMLAGLDRKARLGPRIAVERGWRPLVVARLLVLPDDRTARRRIEALTTTLDRALPARTLAVRGWLRAPEGRLAGILFLSDRQQARARHRIATVRTGSPHGQRDGP
ncbi:MAG: helix-turn-helix transcriptional regulator [Chloroflexi bacterium]|nr:helix-turn-helix transcriptional regulator [Chloroflexota bacterium]